MSTELKYVLSVLVMSMSVVDKLDSGCFERSYVIINNFTLIDVIE